MEYGQAKQQFIQAWGNLGSSWGINKTMAQIHALLLLSNQPMSTDQVMEELQLSRGNCNMNLRALLDWGIAQKVHVPGERKEFYYSDKDVMKLATQVAQVRMKRELEPLIETLTDMQEVDARKGEKEKLLQTVSKDLLDYARQGQSIINLFIKANRTWFFKLLPKLRG